MEQGNQHERVERGQGPEPPEGFHPALAPGAAVLHSGEREEEAQTAPAGEGRAQPFRAAAKGPGRADHENGEVGEHRPFEWAEGALAGRDALGRAAVVPALRRVGGCGSGTHAGRSVSCA